MKGKVKELETRVAELEAENASLQKQLVAAIGVCFPLPPIPRLDAEELKVMRLYVRRTGIATKTAKELGLPVRQVREIVRQPHCEAWKHAWYCLQEAIYINKTATERLPDVV